MIIYYLGHFLKEKKKPSVEIVSIGFKALKTIEKLSNKKDTTIDRSRNMDGPQIHSAVQKRLDSRRATSCTIAFTQHLGQRKTIGTENR